MSESGSFIKRLASVLMMLALRILPSSSEEWAKAMLTEFYYLDHGRDDLSWACGCVIASVKMRYENMIIGNLKISRWILIPELLVCFMPLTHFWLDVTVGQFGIFGYNLVFVIQNISRFPEGTAITVMVLTTAVLGLVGPAGLISAYQLIVMKRPIQNKMTGIILITGPVVLGFVTITCLLIMREMVWLDELGLVLLLFTILPSAGAAHLYYVYTPRQE